MGIKRIYQSVMKKRAESFCKSVVEERLAQLSSPNCSTETLLQSYGILTSLAYNNKDNPELLSRIFAALDLCLKSPSNNDATYDNALMCAGFNHFDCEELRPYTASLYKKISENYGGQSLISNLNGFYRHYPESAPVVTECIKNIYDKKLVSDGNADFGVELLRDVYNSAPCKLKALEAVHSIVKNKHDDVEKINYTYSLFSNVDFDTPETAKKAIDIVKEGINVSDSKSATRDKQLQILDKILDKHHDMAKNVLDVLKPVLNKEEANYRFARMNSTSDLLSKIGTVDSSLAAEVTGIEQRIHPNHPKFKFQNVGDEIILARFGYYDDGSLRYESNWKGNKLHGKTVLMSRGGTVISEESYKDGVKDGLGVLYGSANKVMSVSVYDNDNLTNVGIGTETSPINRLSNGVFLQKIDKGFSCFCPDATVIRVNANEHVVELAEKSGALHQFSGQTATGIIKHMTGFDNLGDRIEDLEKSCKKQLQSNVRVMKRNNQKGMD